MPMPSEVAYLMCCWMSTTQGSPSSSLYPGLTAPSTATPAGQQSESDPDHEYTCMGVG